MSDETTLLVTVDGKDYDVDMGTLLISESIQLKKHTGANREQWYDQVGREEPEAIQFLVWLAKTRAGEDVGRIGEIDADILALNVRPKIAPEEAAEEAEGPTGSPESDEA